MSGAGEQHWPRGGGDQQPIEPALLDVPREVDAGCRTGEARSLKQADREDEALVALGVALSLPGVPGQGLLTVLLGIMLLDFPGRERLEQKLLSKPSIVNTINRLRGRFGKPPLQLN